MKKLNQAITNCPVCQHDLHITHLECSHCQTKISGEFSFSKFNYLNQETLYFIELFVKNRGNIKAVEKEMNISYPTVKKYLDEAIISLGYKVDEIEEEIKTETRSEGFSFHSNIDTKAFKMDILEKIKQGNINVEEALEKLKKLKENK